jgi:hypothetical protein
MSTQAFNKLATNPADRPILARGSSLSAAKGSKTGASGTISSPEDVTKLNAELSIKNRLIYDLKKQESWLSSELYVYKSNASPSMPSSAQDHSDSFGTVDKTAIDPLKLSIMQTLLFFKKETKKAQETVEKVFYSLEVFIWYSLIIYSN